MPGAVGETDLFEERGRADTSLTRRAPGEEGGSTFSCAVSSSTRCPETVSPRPTSRSTVSIARTRPSPLP
jgi:hypothetical protein